MRKGFLVLVLVLVLVLLLAGCGGGGGVDSGSTVPCDDAAFRGQDEELYVTQAAVSNAIGGGDPVMLLLDLRRARTALAGYLDAHPPCDEALVGVSTTEQEAIAALDDAIAMLDEGAAAGTPLATALQALESAQSELSSAR